jgi:hypothetical protein
VKQAVSAAENGIDALCTPPYPTNTAEAIAKVTQAGVSILANWKKVDQAAAPEEVAPATVEPVAPAS